MNNYISVIITAYNRKEFLLGAIKSVLNQTLSKDKYEIIVVKNYNDDEIDEFISKNNIKSILSNNKLVILDGIKYSRGNILSFLEDDDLFLNNRLEYVYNLFNNDNNLVYYHNKAQFINKDNKNIKNMYKEPDFNVSCISIKKEIININNFAKIYSSADTFMYLSALESNKKIISNKSILSCYRVHNSLSNVFTWDLCEFNRQHIKFIDITINNFHMFTNFFSSRKAIRYINSQITNFEISRFSYSNSKMPGNLLNFILFNKSGIKNKITKTSIYLAIRISPNYFRKYIQNKRLATSNSYIS